MPTQPPFLCRREGGRAAKGSQNEGVEVRAVQVRAVQGWTRSPGSAKPRGFCSQPPAMATGGEKGGEQTWRDPCLQLRQWHQAKHQLCTSSRGREAGREGGEEEGGIPRLCTQPIALCRGPPRAGFCSGAPPPSPRFFGEPPHLADGQGDSSSTLGSASPEDSPACILTGGDARLTDSRRSQSPPGPPGTR